MRRTRAGRSQDAAQFHRLVTDHSQALLRTAFMLCADLDEAEDLVQETWTRLARRWPRVRTMDNPTAYARRVLVNLAIDGQRRRSRRRTELAGPVDLTDRIVDTAAEQRMHSVDVSDSLEQALSLLTVRQRAVLVLRYWEDLSEKQIAEVLGCAPGTVKATAAKAIARIRLHMTDPVSTRH